MPSWSIGIGCAENEETVSTIRITSGYFRTTSQISFRGFTTPVDVSLWISVTVSNLPVASCLSRSAGLIGSPQSTCSGVVFLPHRFDTSSHLSEKAPHMQLRTPLTTRFRIAPSITPQAEEVEKKTGC